MQFTYPLQTSSGIEHRALPFVIGVLADLSGQPAHPRPSEEARFVEISRGNFDRVFEEIRPRLVLDVQNEITPGGGMLRAAFEFRRLADFEPEGLCRQWPVLRELREKARESSPMESSELNRVISSRLDRIIQARQFLRLEASWRGLHYLLCEAPESASVRLKVMDISKAALLRDFRRAGAFDRSVIFRRIWDEECGVPGGRPFGLLVGDYELSLHPDDMRLLKAMAGVAAASSAPFIAAASPAMFGCGEFCELPEGGNLAGVFSGPQYAAWRSFRESGEARFAALTLPRVLYRPPYSSVTAPPGDRAHDEDADRRSHLWGNAAYAFAAKVGAAVERHGWFEDLSGLEAGAAVAGLARVGLMTARGLIESTTDCPLDPGRCGELAALGFMPLAYRAAAGETSFWEAPSCARPGRYVGKGADENAARMTQLRYILGSSRFAHGILSAVRESPQRHRPAGEWAGLLNDWIRQYVAPSEAEIYPLLEGRIEVLEQPRHRGGRAVVAVLRLRFRSDRMPQPVRITIPLASP
ncbi:MAG: type VI secretion system contractile sheath large subunit [Acidobacteria bacterium]|nr:type VI secretion system contractile sheath large subunit [Acidobacteriota bacterium]